MLSSSEEDNTSIGSGTTVFVGVLGNRPLTVIKNQEIESIKVLPEQTRAAIREECLSAKMKKIEMPHCNIYKGDPRTRMQIKSRGPPVIFPDAWNTRWENLSATTAYNRRLKAHIIITGRLCVTLTSIPRQCVMLPRHKIQLRIISKIDKPGARTSAGLGR